MTLGEKLLYLRKDRGLSQEQLASEITVSRQAVSKWELGEAVPDTENVIQLTKIFDVSADFLLDDTLDIPIGTNVGKETEQDVIHTMLKNELKDDSDKLAQKLYESQMNDRRRFNWVFTLLGTLVCIAIIAFGVYLVFFR